MGQYQDYSQCNCKESEVCEPPEGDNDGDGVEYQPGCEPGPSDGGGGGGGDDGGGRDDFPGFGDEGGHGWGGHAGLEGFPYDSGNAPPPGPPITGFYQHGEFGNIDSNLIYFDPKYNIEIQNNQTILDFATLQSPTSRSMNVNGLLNSTIRNTLYDILSSQGAQTSYDGTLIGDILYSTNLIMGSLSPGTLENLKAVQRSNISSLNITSLFMRAFRNSFIDGTFPEYTSTLLEDIASTASSFVPNGVPVSAPVNRRETATQLLIDGRKPFNPVNYRGNRTAQERIRHTHILATDTDRCLKVVTRKGLATGFRLNNDDTLGFIGQDGNVSSVKTVNEYCPVVEQGGERAQVALPSNRNNAYYLNSGNLAMVQGLLGAQERLSLEVSTAFVHGNGGGNYEISAGGSAIPEAMLFSAVLSSVADVPSSQRFIRSTSANYELAWSAGMAGGDSVFDSVVSTYCAPNATLYAAQDDGLFNALEKPNIVTLTFNDIDLPPILNDNETMIFPREIYMYFLLCPSNNKKWIPLAGKSRVSAYSSDEGIKRTLNFGNNPLAEVGQTTFLQTISSPTSTDIDGKFNPFAQNFSKGFTDGDLTKELSLNETTLTTQQSSFGLFLSAVSSVDLNYNLEDGSKGKRLPWFDLLSFFTANQYMKFIMEVPESIKFKFEQGDYYPYVKLFNIALTDTEKTYLNSTRLTGTSLADKQIQTTISDNNYYPSQYEGKLY